MLACSAVTHIKLIVKYIFSDGVRPLDTCFDPFAHSSRRCFPSCSLVFESTHIASIGSRGTFRRMVVGNMCSTRSLPPFLIYCVYSLLFRAHCRPHSSGHQVREPSQFFYTLQFQCISGKSETFQPVLMLALFGLKRGFSKWVLSLLFWLLSLARMYLVALRFRRRRLL